MSEHTKEPWAYGSYHRLLVVPVIDGMTDKHAFIADLGETEIPWDKTSDSRERYANARRIVACVNACAGIETELIEIVSDNDKTFSGIIAALEQERDSLAEQVKVLRDALNLIRIGTGSRSFAYGVAEKALATGGKDA